jgi:RNA repair, ligase-Pnkp-associating, region of Hen1
VELVRQAQAGRPSAVLQRKLEHDHDIERPRHAFIAVQEYSNKKNIELNGIRGPNRRSQSIRDISFEPFGYVVNAEHHPLDEAFPEWGESNYYTVELEHEVK